MQNKLIAVRRSAFVVASDMALIAWALLPWVMGANVAIALAKSLAQYYAGVDGERGLSRPEYLALAASALFDIFGWLGAAGVFVVVFDLLNDYGRDRGWLE